MVRRLTELEITNYFSLCFNFEVTFKTLWNADIPFTPPQHKIPLRLLSEATSLGAALLSLAVQIRIFH